jgi:cyclophilin family peptidyl-prolyl cis-trans isomerase
MLRRMPVPARLTPIWTAVLCSAAIGCQPQQQETPADAEVPDAHPEVTLETTAGRVVLELDRAKAPQTVANFLAHVRIGFYDGLIFHRVEQGFVLQAGYYTADGRRKSTSAKPIMNESENGLGNRRGTVAMARTDFPHSATTQFFVNLADNRKLDRDQYPDGWGYAVFGEVREGLGIIDAIAAGQTTRRNREAYWPVDPVVIERAYVGTEP